MTESRSERTLNCRQFSLDRLFENWNQTLRWFSADPWLASGRWHTWWVVPCLSNHLVGKQRMRPAGDFLLGSLIWVFFSAVTQQEEALAGEKQLVDPWVLRCLEKWVKQTTAETDTPFTRYNRFDNRLCCVNKHPIQPVVKPVWQPVWQPCWTNSHCSFNWLTTG